MNLSRLTHEFPQHRAVPQTYQYGGVLQSWFQLHGTIAQLSWVPPPWILIRFTQFAPSCTPLSLQLSLGHRAHNLETTIIGIVAFQRAPRNTLSVCLPNPCGCSSVELPPPFFLQNLYESIKNEPFKIPEDDGNDLTHTFFNPDREGWLLKLGKWKLPFAH